MPPRAPAWLLPLLALLFFLSGACALVYQVMWLRLLALVFGVTVYAASTVLAGFMAGLAVGSFAAGRLAGRLKRPLVAFGVAEIRRPHGARVADPARPADGAVGAGAPGAPESVPVITAIRFACAFAVLILPTSLMGATLPLIVKSAVAQEPRIGGRIGLLYAVNTAGAIIGALTAGFYFISEVGVDRSFVLAAAVNVGIGLVAVAVGAKALPTAQLPAAAPGADAAPRPDSLTARQRRSVLWTFFLSGLLSLALEIVWFRMLVVYLRPTAYAFTIMLAVVLAGIAIGSALATPCCAGGPRGCPSDGGAAGDRPHRDPQLQQPGRQPAWSNRRRVPARPWPRSVSTLYLTPIIVSQRRGDAADHAVARPRLPDGPDALDGRRCR